MNSPQDIHSQFWLGLIAFATLVLMPFIKDFWKDRRERRKDEAERAMEEVKMDLLRDIAGSNKDLARQQTQLNIMLASNIQITNERHAQNLTTMQHICKWHEAALARQTKHEDRKPE
jgi:flagellar biosynthesis/type III secretory pathway M-ring protein FliF/YscJ